MTRRITYQKKVAVKRYLRKHTVKQAVAMFGISKSAMYLISKRPLLAPVPIERLERMIKRDGRIKYYEC